MVDLPQSDIATLFCFGRERRKDGRGCSEQQGLIKSCKEMKILRKRKARATPDSCQAFTSGLPIVLTLNTHISLPNYRTQLLKLATPLVQHHGFTRTTLARSVLSLPEPHAEPLSDSAVTVLFGEGDAARRTLINAWLDEGRNHMRTVPVDGVKRALLARLEYNVPVLRHLPEVCRPA